MNHKVQKFNPDDQTEVLLIYDAEERTFWANQKQMAEMYGVAVNTINEHVKAILSELNDDSVIRSYRIRAIDGKNYSVKHYNHRIILRVGFRCRSPKADIYQEWATGVLFRELMQEKRDEERDAYRPLKRALCMAVDYSSKGDESRFAFATMQDMMHYAAVGATAAGILMGRANAKKQNMGLTTFTGKSGPQKKDVTVAKNYLSDKELDFMSKISHGFMLAIEIATTGRKKHQYTLANLLDEFRDYLIKYHQDVLDPKLRLIRSDEAKRYAASQYLHYKRLLKENLPLIQAGKMKHGQNEEAYEIYEAMLQEDEWEEQDEWPDYLLDDARQNALPPAPDDDIE